MTSTHIRSPQECEQLATRDEVHYHVQVRRILKSTPEVDNKRMLHGLEYLLLIIGVFHLLRFHDLVLAQDFHGIEAEIMLASDYSDSTR